MREWQTLAVVRARWTDSQWARARVFGVRSRRVAELGDKYELDEQIANGHVLEYLGQLISGQMRE